MSRSIVAPSQHRFTLAECRQLSRRAWTLRRYHALRLGVKVMDVSWRECLLLARRESLRSRVWALHAEIVQSFPQQQRLCGVNPDAVFVPGRPVRGRWVAGLARAAVVVLAVIAV